MGGLLTKSVSSLTWRSRALFRSIVPGSIRKRLVPPGMTLDNLGLPLRSIPLSAMQFLFPVDFFPDSTSLAGYPIGEFSHLLELSPELPENDHLVYLLKNQGQAAVDEPVVVAALLDGRWMVLAGERVVAAALTVGMEALAVQVIPHSEALAGIGDRQKNFYPRHRFRRNLRLIDDLREPSENLDPALVELAAEIKRKPLVSMADMYQPLPFAEFNQLSVQADNIATYTRLGLIIDRLGEPEGKKVLDLGCNVGFFVFSLALRGCRASGMDMDSRFVAVGRQVAQIKGIEAQFVTADLGPGSFGVGGALAELKDHPTNDPTGKPWDLITSFSMLQWVEKQHDLAYCRQVLREISRNTRAFLVDIPVNCSGVHLQAPAGREISWLEEFLRDSCDFREYIYAGRVAPYKVDQRHVFYCHH